MTGPGFSPSTLTQIASIANRRISVVAANSPNAASRCKVESISCCRSGRYVSIAGRSKAVRGHRFEGEMTRPVVHLHVYPPKQVDQGEGVGSGAADVVRVEEGLGAFGAARKTMRRPNTPDLNTLP